MVRSSYVWHAILYYTILYYTILYYTILYYTILSYTILYYTILYYTILYCAGLGPSKDNVCTATTPLSQAIIACLSKGPFGLGDEVNTDVSFFSI